MSLKHTYTLIAPFYDAAIDRATRAARKRSLSALPETPGRVLLAGIGTGLDLPHLPPQHQYIGLDLNQAMLRRALPRAGHVDFVPVLGDSQRLPFADASFDAAVLHLILAVVPDPPACLREIARILKPGGKVLIFDKFLRPGQSAPLRRLANPLMRRLATRLDVVFE
ncbi:MAG: class I SAM-dependent methyltransferase, partial [Rhodocyclaceae bacterium]|nr:class I SAM-dependent methyltransferase [Rhodocyclaceae bacterium]